MFGGNSNWRGPVWMPVNFLLYVSLLRLAAYYGDAFTVECPTGSGKQCTLFEVAHDLAGRLIGTFVRDEAGRRPVFGGNEKFQRDPHWRDHILFYEYFHGDNGAGIGASHQTGWTGCIAMVIQADGALSQDLLSRPNAEGAALRASASNVTTTRAARPTEGGPASDFPPGLGKPALRALDTAGYTRLEQLAQVKEADLLKLHGMGPKAIGLLRSALSAKGLAFAGPE